MSRPILHAPDDRLSQRCAPVEDPKRLDATLLTDMFDAMHAAHGAGLAAPQVGVNLRLFILDPLLAAESVFINPRLISGTKLTWGTEGCLSIPGRLVRKKRYQELVVEAMDETGRTFRFNARGHAAVAIQHEMDHLNGRLISD